MNINSTFRSSISNSLDILPQKIAVAVSGGPDSLALLMLSNSFAIEQKIDLTAITVNHNIREEAKKEAEYVSVICSNLGIKHVILSWKREGDLSTMHAHSREARYNLMTDYCNKNEIPVLLTGHHADDKIESFFIRLSRASGLLGLSPAEENIYRNITVLRPLSNIYKKELIDYISSFNINYIDDTSNYDPKYQRSNIRKWIEMIPEELEPNLFKNRILKSLDHIKEISSYISEIIDQNLNDRAIIHEAGYATYKFSNCYNYIEFMILSHLLTMISGYNFTPRSSSIKKLYEKLVKEESSKSTLHGCIIVKKANHVFIYRSFGKQKPEEVPLSKDTKWDNRWESSINEDNLFIGHLSMEDWITLKNDKNFTQKDIKIDHNILFTIPVIFEKNILEVKTKKILAIPHIGYYNNPRYNKDSLVFKPNYKSRLIHFS